MVNSRRAPSSSDGLSSKGLTKEVAVLPAFASSRSSQHRDFRGASDTGLECRNAFDWYSQLLPILIEWGGVGNTIMAFPTIPRTETPHDGSGTVLPAIHRVRSSLAINSSRKNGDCSYFRYHLFWTVGPCVDPLSRSMREHAPYLTTARVRQSGL